MDEDIAELKAMLIEADSYLSWIIHRYGIEASLKMDIERLIPRIRKVTG